MPSFWRTLAGTEIWPCAVSLEWAIAMRRHYHGNGQVKSGPLDEGSTHFLVAQGGIAAFPR